MYGNKAPKIAGVEIFTEIDGRVLEIDMKKCCHCGSYWRVIKGSGIQRGHCTRCDGPVCGPACFDTCYPHEQQLLDEAKKLNQLIKQAAGG